MPGGVPPNDDSLIGDDEFQTAFGEALSTTLDVETWDRGFDLEGLMERFRREIASAVNKEERLRTIIRNELLPRLAGRPRAPSEAGVYRVLPEQLTTIHENLLFPGQVEAVNGISVAHDSLPIGITQIGIAVVGYGGTSGTFSQRLFRKEMSSRNEDTLKEALAYIEMRQNRSGMGRRDGLSRLVRRGIRTYAERAILVDKARAEWRIGQGNPCAHELLSGSGCRSLLEASLGVLRRLIQDHKKFVFVPSTLEERGILTIGYALDAGEYAIINTLERYGEQLVAGWHYEDRGKRMALAFVRECCPDVLMGLFRTSNHSPPRIFHAHREHVHLAARVAMADSILRPERGFPLLLDVASTSCRGAFGAEGFLGLVHDAYAQAGANLQYFTEHELRR
jgi:hypothetical protein